MKIIKCITLAEQARIEGDEIRITSRTGRPTGVLHGLQSSFHAFVGHPTWKNELASLELMMNLLARLRDPEIKKEDSCLKKPRSKMNLFRICRN